MEYFEKLKTKFKVGNLIGAVVFLALSLLFGALAGYVGFSSETKWRLGFRYSRSGIPIPNWLISVVLTLFAVLMLIAVVSSLKAFFKNTEYQKMMQEVRQIGDAETLGTILSETERNPLATSGKLYCTDRILFYLNGTNATAVDPQKILRITTRITGSGSGETNYLRILHTGGVLEFTVKAKNILPLLNELRERYHVEK